MPQNFHRPDINYIAVSRQNDQRYQLLTRNKKRPPTDFLIDLDYNYLIDTVNKLDVRIDGISLGNLPGVNDPTNFGKLLTPDGAGSSSWVFVQANNILDSSLTGSKLFPQTITSRELADGGIPDTKIAPNAVTTIKILDENVTSNKLADDAVIASKIAAQAVTFEKMANDAVYTEILVNDAVTTDKIADDNVTLAKLAPDVLNFVNALVPIGTSMAWSASTAPVNINGVVEWVEENGQLLNRVTYAALFALIGTTYGAGDGATTFAVPDRRGRSIVGIGSDNSTGGRITGSTAPSIILGGTFGSETHTLTTPQIPSHSHAFQISTDLQGGGGVTRATGPYVSGISMNSDLVGGDQPHNNVQPSIFTRYYMRAK